MPATLNEQTTVGEWVVREPHLGRIFEDLGIDYCCGGKVSLEEACRRRQLAPREVMRRLQKADPHSPGADAAIDAGALTLTALADHIEQTHHAYLRRELPRLFALTQKVARAHGSRHPGMIELAEVFRNFQHELEQHMFKEEHVLFPMIRVMEQPGPLPGFHCGSIANPVAVMEHEHDNAGDALARMRRLSDDYQPPSDACNTFRVLLDSLSRLEADMHQHVHKENNVLFPRAVELEARRRVATGS